MFRFAPFLLLAGCSSLLGIDSLDQRQDAGALDAAALLDGTVPPMDAPAALTGLGAPCGDDTECEASDICVLLNNNENGPGFCTALCQDEVVFLTDANGTPASFNPNPAAQNGFCVGQYRGTIGNPACALLQNVDPPPPFQPETTYTADFFCVLLCQSASDCPSTHTCDLNVGGACMPVATP